MALSASYPSNPTAITPVSMDRLADLRNDRHCADMQNPAPKDVSYDMENVAGSTSATSSPTTQKESLSTEGDCTDSQQRGGSENGTDITAPDTEPADNSSKPSAPVDKRAEKRRMKRFRLTHNQTRYLMSEFTRQPHPDAAHRERLSREIPGLSPRQVQVWFQNRRAKLKRLTSDDRERMLKSRALPDDFDMAQALHSPYGNCPNPADAPLPSPGDYPRQEADLLPASPMTADGFKTYDDEYVTSPLSATSAWHGYFSSHSVNVTRPDMSPTHPSQTSSPVQANPYMRPCSFPNASQPLPPPLQNIHFADGPARPRTVSLNSPHPYGSYTSAPLSHSAPSPPSSQRKDSDPSFPSHSSPKLNLKTDAKFLQENQPRSSPRPPTSASHVPSVLHLETGNKEVKPPLQSAPLSVPQECQGSPLSPHYPSSGLGFSYAAQLVSTMSLPASPFFFEQGGKHPDEYGAVDNASPALPDSFHNDGRPYTATFQFTSGQ